MQKRKICILFFSFLVLFFSAKAQKQPNLYQNVDQKKMTHWVDSVFDKMTLNERVGQLFMIIADPSTNDKNQQKIIKNIKEQYVGGILFAKGDLMDQAKSTNLYQEQSKIPLLISLDGEWGLSMRLTDTPKFPRNMVLGAIADSNLIYRYGEEVGRECKRMGIHINFAPVLDVNSNPDNPVIGTRSFGENTQSVTSKGIAYSQGLESVGIIAVAKHFPGHGDTDEDSHRTSPVVNHNLARLEQVELYPFKQYIKGGFSGMMTGHLIVPALDSVSGKPASLSSVIINDLLKGKLGFKGLTFTDALVMKGADSGTESVCVQALLAGNDVLLSPANPVSEFNAVKKAINSGVLDVKDIEQKCIKILCYKYIAGLNNYKPINTRDLKNRLNSSESERLISQLNEASITLLKNTNDLVPLKNLETRKIAVLSIGGNEDVDFQQYIGLYSRADYYNLPINATDKAVMNVFKKLENYNTIICGIHSHNVPDYLQIRPLSLKSELYCCFFISPYKLSKYKQLVEWSKASIIAYENTNSAQRAAAQVLMGGLPATGSLPVKVSGLFREGTGIQTKKVRLSYRYPEQVGVSSSELRQIDEIVNDAIKKKAFPGCQVLVARKGVVIYNKSFGFFDFADTHPVKISDVYDLASVTKAAATVPALMKLYDSKAYKLNDPLGNYIPELKKTDKEGITIKEALMHESGLVSFIPFYEMAIDKKSYSGPLFSSKRSLVYRTEYDLNTFTRTDFKFRADLVSDEKKEGYDLQVAKQFYLKPVFKEMILKKIADSSLKSKNEYLYSDLNFMLLKEMAENLSKQDIDKYLNDNFYAPLGAYTTTFKPLSKVDTLTIAPTENDEFLRNQILIGYPDDEAAAFMGGVSGNAGLFSSANDLAKLLQLILNKGEYGGQRFLSEETCNLFTKTKSKISRRGLGFDKPADEEGASSPCCKSAPGSVYGHTGFTGTCFWVDPDNQLIYVFLSNRVYPSRTNRGLMKQDVRSRIQEVIYDAIDPRK